MWKSCAVFSPGAAQIREPRPGRIGLPPLNSATEPRHVELVCTFLKHGADPNIRKKDMTSPLHWASGSGRLNLWHILLESGADFMTRNNRDWTPLHSATYKGKVAVAHTLLEHGADATARCEYGRTPLHLSSETGFVDLTRMLLEYGADMFAQDKWGKTPLNLAAAKKRAKLIRILLEHRGGATASAIRAISRTPTQRSRGKCWYHDPLTSCFDSTTLGEGQPDIGSIRGILLTLCACLRMGALGAHHGMYYAITVDKVKLGISSSQFTLLCTFGHRKRWCNSVVSVLRWWGNDNSSTKVQIYGHLSLETLQQLL